MTNVQVITHDRLYSVVRIAAGLLIGLLLGFMTLSVSIFA